VDYSVRVDAIATSQFKLTWQQGAELMAGPYKVNQRILLDIVDKQVRSRLNGLTTLASTGKLAESGGALQELAKAGWELYKVLFNAEGKGGNANAEAVEAGLRAASAGSTLCVFVQEHVYVPWGLVYDVEPAEHAVIDYEVYREHFWCLRFRLATVYDSSVGQDELAPEFDASGFDLIAGIDRTLLAKVAACASCGPELAAFEELRRQHGNHVHASSAADWLHLWKTHEARLGLLYFYGHSDQTTLSFGAGKKVNFIDFGYKYRKVTYPPLCLVFLNGCHTAEGDETGGFLEVTGSDGFCGFVGTEAPVPDIFAFRFAVAMTALLYQGGTLVEIMEHLRKAHWPLSLLYGLYAYPFLRLTPRPDLSLPSLSKGNYSDHDLGHLL
jgi:hypothetical protein